VDDEVQIILSEKGREKAAPYWPTPSLEKGGKSGEGEEKGPGGSVYGYSRRVIGNKRGE